MCLPFLLPTAIVNVLNLKGCMVDSLQVLVVFLLLCAASSGNQVVELNSGVLTRHAAQLAG